MASPKGASSGSSLFHDPGCEEDQQAVMDKKKRKRMVSNRESARRSRMRRQKKLSDLIAEVDHLKKENSQVFALLSTTRRRYSAVEAENSIMRAQMMELGSALQYLNEMPRRTRSNSINRNMAPCDGPGLMDSLTSSLNTRERRQFTTASADMFYH